MLALRGDPPGGRRDAVDRRRRAGLTYAVELVGLVTSLGGFDVGVAAFPEGHREAATLDADARGDEGQGRRRSRLRDHRSCSSARPTISDSSSAAQPSARRCRSSRASCRSPTSVRSLDSPSCRAVGARRGGGRVRRSHRSGRRAEGRDRDRERLCDEVLREGAPGLHFYTLNRSRATREIYAKPQAPRLTSRLIIRAASPSGQLRTRAGRVRGSGRLRCRRRPGAVVPGPHHRPRRARVPPG